MNLLRLGADDGSRAISAKLADRLLSAFASRISASPVTMPQMLVAYEFSLSKPKAGDLVGETGSTRMLREMNARFRAEQDRAAVTDDDATRKALRRICRWSRP